MFSGPVQHRHLSIKVGLTALSVFIISATPAFATNGYFSQAHGVQSKGMVGVGTAGGSGPLALMANPAAGTKVGRAAEGCISIFMPDRDVSFSGGGLGTRKVESNNSAFPIPCAGVNVPLDEKSSIGIVLTGNGGMNTEYDFPIFGGSSPVGVDMAQMFIGVNYAHEVADGLSLGIMPTLAGQTFSAQGLEGFAGMSANPGSLTNRGHDYSWGGGLRLGAMWDINPMVTVGASYQTRMLMSKFNKYSGLFAEQGDFDIPPAARIGVAVRPVEDWTVHADWERIFYSEVASIGNKGGNASPLGSDLGPGFGWQDMDIWRLGVEWKTTPDLTLRAGYSHASAFTSNTEVTFNILAPATIQDHASIGFSYAIDDSWEVSGAYTRAFSNSLNGPTPMLGGNATLRMDQHEFALGTTYRW